MLVNLKEILEISKENKIAIGAFNTPDLTCLKAIIGAAEELNQPVIIMHAQLHEDMGLCTVEDVAPSMVAFAKAAKVPVCVHLDHGTDLEYIKKALSLGFTSVMYDGSTLDGEENIKNTKLAVEEARKYGASVEGEIGYMGAREGGIGDEEAIYTEPEDAAMFVKRTGVDALACAFGTAHGFKAAAKLDYDRLSTINDMIDVPIVMHGGSGISEEEYREVIKRGVTKVNYYTFMAKAGADAVSNKEYRQFHDVLMDAEKEMRKHVKNAIMIFSNLK